MSDQLARMLYRQHTLHDADAVPWDELRADQRAGWERMASDAVEFHSMPPPMRAPEHRPQSRGAMS